jgi:hypothetical protein
MAFSSWRGGEMQSLIDRLYQAPSAALELARRINAAQ